MSKLTKLFKTPNLFLRDFFAKRAGVLEGKNEVNLELVDFTQSFHFLLHSGEGKDAGSLHLNSWLSVFQKAEVSFLVLVRNQGLYNWVREYYPKAPVALARQGSDVEEILKQLPDIKTVFYPSSTGNNIHLVRFNYLNHIFIGHGDSDKASSANKALRLYDEIWVAGQAHIDRFKQQVFDTSHLKFKKIGRPQTLTVMHKTLKPWQERTIRLLYLPTWEGYVEEANYSSLHLAKEIIDLSVNTLKLSTGVKFHSLTGKRYVSLKTEIDDLTNQQSEQSKRFEVFDNSLDINYILPSYTFFVCDHSAVITDALAANGPIFLYQPNNKTLTYSNSLMPYSNFCYCYHDLDELKQHLKSVLDGNDPLASKRLEARQYLLGEKETRAEVFKKALAQL